MFLRALSIPRLRAACLHLAISAFVAGAVAAIVFLLWYPGAYRTMAGGEGLFFLVVSVDVVLGPLLTLVAFDVGKRRTELRRDLAVIAALQLGALAYGVHTVYVVRPVAIVYEIDRFRVVAAGEVREAEMPSAPPAYRRLPITGPWQLGVRSAEPGAERGEAIFLGLAGFDTSQRPTFWRPYADVQELAYERARPVAVLQKQHAAHQKTIETELGQAGIDVKTARFMPVRTRGDWVVVLTPGGKIAHFMPFDGYF